MKIETVYSKKPFKPNLEYAYAMGLIERRENDKHK